MLCDEHEAPVGQKRQFPEHMKHIWNIYENTYDINMQIMWICQSQMIFIWISYCFQMLAPKWRRARVPGRPFAAILGLGPGPGPQNIEHIWNKCENKYEKYVIWAYSYYFHMYFILCSHVLSYLFHIYFTCLPESRFSAYGNLAHYNIWTTAPPQAAP